MSILRRGEGLLAGILLYFAGSLLISCADESVLEVTHVERSVFLQVADQDGLPVQKAVIVLTRGAETYENVTDSDGRADYSLSNGQYDVLLTLPRGYEVGESTPSAIRIEQDGPATIPMPVSAVRTARIEASPGKPDTVALANGSQIEISVPPEVTGAVLIVAEAGSVGDPEEESFGGVTVTIESPGATSLSIVSPAATSGSPWITISLGTLMPEGTTADAGFAIVEAESEGETLFLYADASSTTITLPTGETRIEMHSVVEVAPDPQTLALAMIATNTQCDNDPRDLRQTTPVDPADTSGRPLLLIHGWQKKDNTCDEVAAFNPMPTWSHLIDAIEADPVLDAAYRIYLVRYPTFERVLKTSGFLDDLIENDPDFSDPVLLGHSMGGLVARGVDAIRETEGRSADVPVITLGTPHRGTPAANWQSRRTWDGLRLMPPSDGIDDLKPDEELITGFLALESIGDPIYTFAGIRGPSSTSIWYGGSDALLVSGDNDGLVPTTSAAPEWSRLQIVLDDHDHTQIRTSSDVTEGVLNVLRSLTAEQCLPAPPALDSNDFTLSGTVSRQPSPSDNLVDVVLNPIVLNGVLQTEVTAEQFMIVENGCARPFTMTQDEGVVGLDLVFVQDLSGSMGSAISGVRESVRSFADGLAMEGVDVRFAAVGFSGEASTIPSSPYTSPYERIGPVQEFTDVSTFQGHVAAKWYASGGGDGPENPLEAIEYAHQNLAWRTGAVRAYVLITDASVHIAGGDCDGYGACTDQTLDSAADLIGDAATIHVVSSTYASGNPDTDPQRLAELTGGTSMGLGSGYVDLSRTGLGETLAQIIRLTFLSASSGSAFHQLRIRATLEHEGKEVRAELIPNLIFYDHIDTSLIRSR